MVVCVCGRTDNVCACIIERAIACAMYTENMFNLGECRNNGPGNYGRVCAMKCNCVCFGDWVYLLDICMYV